MESNTRYNKNFTYTRFHAGTGFTPQMKVQTWEAGGLNHILELDCQTSWIEAWFSSRKEVERLRDELNRHLEGTPPDAVLVEKRREQEEAILREAFMRMESSTREEELRQAIERRWPDPGKAQEGEER